MVHQCDHRHSSYHPPSPFDCQTGQSVKNKNYQQQEENNSGRSRSVKNRSSSSNNNNNNNNHSSSSTSSLSPTSSNAVNDNDTFARFWPQSANNGGSSSHRPWSSSGGGGSATLLLPPSYPSGPISGGTSHSNNSYSAVENDVRWSKLLRHDGTPTKVLLYPEEGWARTATNAYWLLSIPWWNRNRCKVVEVVGTRRSTTQAKLIDAGDRRTVYVVGSFKSSSSSSSPDLSSSEPQFKLALTSHITTADVNLGYLMTGTLERGRHGDSLQPTHFAVLSKFDWNSH